MSVMASQLADYVGANQGEYSTLLQRAVTVARALVTHYIGSSTVPTEVQDEAVLEVAADLFNRRNAPNGIVNTQFVGIASGEGETARVRQDPMRAAYGILRRWVLPWHRDTS